MSRPTTSLLLLPLALLLLGVLPAHAQDDGRIIFTDPKSKEEKLMGSEALDLLMIAKYFERIGDHATNIAEWVEYSVTGLYKGEVLQ